MMMTPLKLRLLLNQQSTLHQLIAKTTYSYWDGCANDRFLLETPSMTLYKNQWAIGLRVMEVKLEQISNQIDAFLSEVPLYIRPKHNLTKLQSPNKKCSVLQLSIKKEAAYEQTLIASVVRLLLTYNFNRLISMEIHLFEISYFIWDHKRHRAFHQNNKKSKILRYIIASYEEEGIEEENEEKLSDQWKKQANTRVIITDLIRQVEDFVNYRCSSQERVKPLPNELIKFSYESLLHMPYQFSKKQREMFLLFLRGMFGLENVQITHKTAIQFYEFILITIRNWLRIKWTSVIKLKPNKNTQPLIIQERGRFWTPEKDQFLVDFVSDRSGIFVSKIHQQLVSRFPQANKIVSYNMIRGRIIYLARKEFNRIKQEGQRLDIDVSMMFQTSYAELEAFMRRKISQTFKIMLIRCSKQKNLNKDTVIELLTTFQTAHYEFLSRKLWVKTEEEESSSLKLEESTSNMEEDLETDFD